MSKTETKFLNAMKRACNIASSRLADYVYENINKKYVETINKFYEDYDPIYYDRRYNLYRGYSGFYNKIKKRLSDGTYLTGIEVGAEFIGNNPYKISADYVFNRAFEQGIHGITKEDLKKRASNVDPIKAMARELAGKKPLFEDDRNIQKKMTQTHKHIMNVY